MGKLRLIKESASKKTLPYQIIVSKRLYFRKQPTFQDTAMQFYLSMEFIIS